MSKFTPPNFNSIQNETSFLGQLNATMERIKASFENTLSRDGSVPNQMGADLDVNSNHIVNMAKGTQAGHAVEYTQLQDTLDEINADILYIDGQVVEATNQANRSESEANDAENSAISAAADLATIEALLETYNNSFLGTFASDPTRDNSGNPLDVGDLYYNSITHALMVYDGTDWQDVAAMTPTSVNTVYNKTYVDAIFRGAFTPETNDGVALGTSALKFSDLFLASGAVINFDSGDVNIVHGTNSLSFTGATSGYYYDNNIYRDATFYLSVPSNNPALNFDTGDYLQYVRSGNYFQFVLGGVAKTGITASSMFPVVNDSMTLGATTANWSDLFLASGAVINFNNGDVTITHSTDALSFAGAASGYSFDNNIYRDSTLYLGLISGSPVVNFDTGDYLVYDRSGNSYQFVLNGAARTIITASSVAPGATGSRSLGTSTNGWSSLFLSNGAVINFNNGNAVITHSSGTINVSTGALKVSNNRVLDTTDVCGISYSIDGGGTAITTGLKWGVRVPFACTINEWSIGLDQSGSIVIDIWKDTDANYPPVVGDTITASAKPTVSSATHATSSTLTGWTTSVAAGDWLFFNVDSITAATFATINLKVTRV